MKITAVIERNDKNFYQISSSTSVSGCTFGGYGHSIEEAKEDFLASIEEMGDLARDEGREWPDSFEVEYTYDLPSFFDCFDWINVSKFASAIGVNASKMRAYRSGLSNASEKTALKILDGVRRLGSEMSAACL